MPSFVRTRDNCLVISTEGNLAAQEAKKRNLLGDTYCQKFSLCLIFQYSTKKSDKTDSQFIHDKKHCCFSFYLANILLSECTIRLSFLEAKIHPVMHIIKIFRHDSVGKFKNLPANRIHQNIPLSFISNSIEMPILS